MNKTTKIALNYSVGILVTALLLWNLYHQVRVQSGSFNAINLWPKDTIFYLIAALCLIPINLGIEIKKWQILVGSANPISFLQAAKSVLGGIAFSLITPNRIGEYPGRILLLDKHHSTRLISVSVLGGCAQFLTVLLSGLPGLLYFCFHRDESWIKILLLGNCISVLIVGIFYWRFERWAPFLERIKWLKRIHMYGQMLARFSSKEQGLILGLSLLRYAVFTLQYFLLLHWMHIEISFAAGYILCALFFWAMAVIPTIALAELGVRGQVSLWLFGAFTINKIGILTATFSLWTMNLVLPALIGSLLLLRLRFLR